MKYFIYIFLFISTNSIAQDVSLLLNEETFQEYHYNKIEKRKIMNVKQKWNPLVVVSSGFLFLYQRVISHQLQADCTYKITCSQYTKLSIEQLGLVKGSLLGFYQLQSCFSHNHKDYPTYKLSWAGIINNQIGLEE